MSSNAFAAPLRLEPGPSRQRRRWRRLTHLAAAASLPLLQSPWLIALVALLLMVSWRRTRAEPAYVLLDHGDGRWTLWEDGRETEAMLAGNAFIQPWLVILPLRVGARRRLRHVAVFPDMLPAHEFRRLRVRLALRNGADRDAAAHPYR